MSTSGEILVLHTSDTHLGLRQYGLEEREKDVYDAFREVIETAIRERVDMILHAGDFFDNYRPPPQALLVAINSLRKARDRGIPVVSILGEHDTPKRRSFPALLLLQELGLVRVLGYNPRRRENYFSVIKTRSGEVFVAGISNHRQASEIKLLPERLRSLPSPPPGMPSILLLHQSLRDLVPVGELSIHDLPRNYSYYALGHIHSFAMRSIEGKTIAYSGSTEVVRMDEILHGGEKYVLLVHVNSNSSEIVEKIKIASIRPQEIIETSYDKLEEKLVEFIRRIGVVSKKPIVHISVYDVPLNVRRKELYSRIERKLRNHVLFYRLVVVQGKDELGEVSLPRTDTMSLEDIARKVLGDEEKADLLIKLVRLLGYSGSSSDMQEAIRVVKDYARNRYGVEI